MNAPRQLQLLEALKEKLRALTPAQLRELWIFLNLAGPAGEVVKVSCAHWEPTLGDWRREALARVDAPDPDPAGAWRLWMLAAGAVGLERQQPLPREHVPREFIVMGIYCWGRGVSVAEAREVARAGLPAEVVRPLWWAWSVPADTWVDADGSMHVLSGDPEEIKPLGEVPNA